MSIGKSYGGALTPTSPTIFNVDITTHFSHEILPIPIYEYKSVSFPREICWIDEVITYIGRGCLWYNTYIGDGIYLHRG